MSKYLYKEYMHLFLMTISGVFGPLRELTFIVVAPESCLHFINKKIIKPMIDSCSQCSVAGKHVSKTLPARGHVVKMTHWTNPLLGKHDLVVYVTCKAPCFGGGPWNDHSAWRVEISEGILAEINLEASLLPWNMDLERMGKWSNRKCVHTDDWGEPDLAGGYAIPSHLLLHC